MAKNNKAALRAQEEKARLEQAARDRRNQTIIGVVVVVVLVAILVVVGVVIWRANQPATTQSKADAKAEVSKVAEKPDAAGTEFGFLLSKNGINDPVENVPTVEVYLDFLCPACGSLERAVSPTWQAMMEAGQLNVEIHPNAFLDQASTDNFSTRSAAATTYIAQNEPDKVLPFIEAMFAEDVQPAEGSSYQPFSNDDIAKVAVDAGVSEDVAKAAVEETYSDWVGAVSRYTVLRPEVQHPSGQYKGQMTTPTVLINGNFWDVSAAYSATGDLSAAFLTSVGLDADKVGQADALPSIGADKDPIALK